MVSGICFVRESITRLERRSGCDIVLSVTKACFANRSHLPAARALSAIISFQIGLILSSRLCSLQKSSRVSSWNPRGVALKMQYAVAFSDSATFNVSDAAIPL